MSLPTPTNIISALKQYPRTYASFVHAIMNSNKFWYGIWTVCGSVLLICVVLNAGLFIVYTKQAASSAAVGMFDANRDPFSAKLRGGDFSSASDELYEDALPLNFSQWTWQAVANWRSSGERHEGPHVLQISALAPGGVVGATIPAIDISRFGSVSLWVRPDTSVGDLYLTLYDSAGVAAGTQSLGWYTPDGHLTSNNWQMIQVPLANIVGSSSPVTVIKGFGISSKNPGTSYADSIKFEKGTLEHSVWVLPPEISSDELTTASPIPLPYTLFFTSSGVAAWHTSFGMFTLIHDGVGDGIVAGSASSSVDGSGSLSVLPAGREWSDYKVEAGIQWGMTSAMTLIVRFKDEKNFAACSFSRGGNAAQIYTVVDGVTTIVKETGAREKGSHLSVAVQGNRILCYVNDKQILSAIIDDLPSRGTIGIETWAPDMTSRSHTLRSLSVTPVTHE